MPRAALCLEGHWVKMRPAAAVMAHPRRRMAVGCHRPRAQRGTSCCAITGASSAALRGGKMFRLLAFFSTNPRLSGRQRGIFALRTIHPGEYVATFGQLRKAQGTSRECLLIQNSSGQKEYFRWKPVDTVKHLGALANSTCCNHHCNAEIIHTGALSDEGTLAHAWIRMLKSVETGEEILVYYGDSYFTDAQCSCCRCAGKCGAKALSLHDRPW